MIHTVGIYGSFVPLTFKGRLVFKEYNYGNTEEEIKRTNELFVDTIYYETDKVMRQLAHVQYGDARDLVIQPFHLLNDPYRIVYNRKASPSNKHDNTLFFLQNFDPNARGCAIILKEDTNGNLISLTEEEANQISSQLRMLL